MRPRFAVSTSSRLAAVLGLTVAAASPLADPLPEPLELEVALEALPPDLPAELLSAQYQQVAIAARAFECRAQDRAFSEWGRVETGGCGYWHLLSPSQQSRLHVMRRFFDVLDADHAAARDEESMAVAYVELDRARNRRDLGQYSELRVAELDTDYQQARRDLYVSQASRRASRALLAIALGRPNELPATLAAPTIPEMPATLGEAEGWQTEAEANNPQLMAWRERAATDPSVDPVYRQLVLDLRESLLEIWLAFTVLRAEHDSKLAMENRSDLRLETARTLYELEAKADLGDSMAAQTAARLATLRVKHRLAMLAATLNALRGRPLFPLVEDAKP